MIKSIRHLTFLYVRQSFRNEVDRNRLKVMEINYFLDAKQAEFDVLTAKLYNEKDADSRSSPTMMTAVTMETYNDIIITTNIEA